MTQYRIRHGYGPHTVGRTTYYAGQCFESDKDLVSSNPKKFELVTASGVAVQQSVWGTEVTPEFPHAASVAGLRVFLKGRRYRLTLNGALLETEPNRMHNQDQVNENIDLIIKKRKGEVELDNSEVEDEEEDDTDSDTEAESESESEAEGEDDAIVGKPKKKGKTRR